jgi:hypothetical protein
MKIRNAIIITDADTEVHMTLEEQADFTGNVVFSRDKLPNGLVRDLDRVIGRSRKDKATAPDLSRMSMKTELLG